MRLSYSLGSLLTIDQILVCSKKLNKFRPDVIWIPETWGMENFSLLSLVSSENTFSKIGSSIINIYSRSPSLIAMGAATLDTISNKRLILGLGTSSEPIVENFHGNVFNQPIKRMREYVEIIRLVLSGKTINYSSEIFSLKNFSLLIKPPRNVIPIYLAAINKKMIDLTWEIADGVIFYLRPKNNIFDEYEKTGLKNNYELVTESMVNELCICGTPTECKKQLKQFYETGIDLPIIQFNPIDDVQESFDLVTATFSEEFN